MTTKEGSGGPAEQRDGNRPGRTIDLKATEIASEPVAAQRPVEPPAADPREAVQPDVAPGSSPQEGEAQPHMQSEMPRTDMPPVQPPSPEIAPAPRSRLAIALVAAGTAGAAGVLLALVAAGMFSRRESGTPPVVEARLARAEQQLRELAARPLPVAADPKAVDDLAARVSRLETAVAAPRQPATDTTVANRIATLEGEIKAVGERAGVLARRNDEIASIAGEARARAEATAASLAEMQKAQPPAASIVQRTELEALSGRIVALERTAKAIESKLSRAAAEERAERSLRLLVVASALNGAVDRGAPFVAELDAAKAIAPDPKALTALDRFAKSGVPGSDALARELAALIPALAKAVGSPPRDGSVLDRLKANAEKIVRVRPIDKVVGDDSAAIVQRIEARAAQGNLAGAIAELAKLPVPAGAVAQEWITKVEARNAAIEASRQFAADSLAAVGKPSL